jgi:hypothetical protein
LSHETALEQTVEAVKAAGAKELMMDIDLVKPEATHTVADQTLSAIRSHQRPPQFRGGGAVSRPF